MHCLNVKQVQAALAIRGGYVPEIFREYQILELQGITVFPHFMLIYADFKLNFTKNRE